MKTSLTCWLAALALAAATLPAAAQDTGLEDLTQAFVQLSGQARFARPAQPPRLELPGMTVPTLGIGADDWRQMPQPDGQTESWLSQRLPGMDLSNVRVVTADQAEQVMRRAADAKATYLDVMTNEAFRGQPLFFLPQAALDDIDAKFISGTLAIRGKSEDGKPFQMQGFLIGQSQVVMLFDHEFIFNEEGRRYRVTNGGRVTARVMGPGDISIDGISAYGAPIFCPWAKLQRITKDAPYKVRVQTSCGGKDGVDVDPVKTR